MANPYNLLQSLLPKEALQIGTSQGPNGDGTTDVLLLGGGLITASGDGYSNGTPVFVKGSRITAQAPSLTPVDIDV